MDNFLYTDASRATWLERLDFSEQAVGYCDNQFVIEGDKVAGFIVIDPDNGTHFQEMVSLIWKPDAKHQIQADNTDSFLPKVIMGKHVHFFVHRSIDRNYLYIGQGFCSSSDSSSDLVHNDVTFNLSRQLPDQWAFLFGCFEGWRMAFDGESYYVSTWEEVLPYATRLLETSHHDLILVDFVDFKEKAFIVASVDDAVFLDFASSPSSETTPHLVSRNLDIPLNDDDLINFYVHGNHAIQAPRHCFVPKTYLLEVIQQYIEDGSLSDKIRWDTHL